MPCRAAKERARGEGKIRDRGGADGHVKTEGAETGVWCYHEPRTTRGHEALGKARKGLPRASAVCVSCCDFELGLLAPEQGENHFLLFKATKFVELG